ncbi:MAG: DUF721 domain-containing protein [Alphaproteobacteria bacterium]|nr:DUF721 domain-containing protein [Alphaproteobacteria bacterium]
MAHYKKLDKGPKKRGGYAPKSISNAIGRITKSIVGKRGFIEVDIITNWAAIVGDEIASYVSPTNIIFPRNSRNSGALHVQVLSGAFAIELQHREKQIIERLNSYFGYNAISSLKITQQPTLKAVIGSGDGEGSSDRPSKPELSDEEKDIIKDSAGCDLDDAYDEKPQQETHEDATFNTDEDEDIKSQELSKALARLGAEILTDNSKKKK